jgi:hypothetical protein
MTSLISSLLLAAALYMTIVLAGQFTVGVLSALVNRKLSSTNVTGNGLAVAILWGAFYWVNGLE